MTFPENQLKRISRSISTTYLGEPQAKNTTLSASSTQFFRIPGAMV